MPIVGETHTNDVVGRRYTKKPHAKYARAIMEMATDIQNDTNLEYFTNVQNVLMTPDGRHTMQNFFVNESADPAEFLDDPDAYQDHLAMMEQLFENDRSAFLEYSAMSNFNPVMGLVFPIHKNLLMNNVFDKGAINKAVAKTPKFTLTMEVRKLVRPDGKEIDIFTDQNMIYDAIESTAPEVFLGLDIAPSKPITPDFDAPSVTETTPGWDAHYKIYTALFGEGAMPADYAKGEVKLPTFDNIAITAAITHLVTTEQAEAGQLAYFVKANADHKIPEGAIAVVPTGVAKSANALAAYPISRRTFDPGYGELDRQLMAEFNVLCHDGNPMQGYISGFMKDNRFYINCTSEKVSKLVLAVRRDTSSAMLDTCSVKWDAITKIEEIPHAIPINVAVSPEEIKDIQALYNQDQLSKLIEIFKATLGTYKDDKIRVHLDQSFMSLPASQKIQESFDFAPPTGYALDFVEWRHKTFMDVLDTYVTTLLQVLNDPNMTITVVGNPSIIRKITPTEYTYQSPSNIGPVDLQFNRTVVTSDKRTYNFISSDKLRNNSNLIILLNPRNTDRVVYCVYDYQLYLTNEIRNKNNYALPAISAFERFKLVAYQPVQGRIRILNPIGSRTRAEVLDPIGRNAMNDYTMNIPDFVEGTPQSNGTYAAPEATAYPTSPKYFSNAEAKDLTNAKLYPAGEYAKTDYTEGGDY